LPKRTDLPTLDTTQLVKELRNRILTGKFPEGKVPTLSELERGEGGLKAGRYASRLAFKLLAEEGLIEFRGKLGTFVRRPDRMRNPARRSGLIGLIIPIMHFEFIGKVAAGILKALDERNEGKSVNSRYRMISACSQGECEREGRLLRELSEEVDGLVVFPIHNHQVQAGKRDRAAFEAVGQKKVPLILVVRKPEFPVAGPVVSFPEEHIAKEVAAHVIAAIERWPSKSKRSVFIVGEWRNSMHATRVQKIWEALHVHLGGSPVEVVQVEEREAIREQAGQRVAARLVDDGMLEGRQSLIVCTTDLIAIGVIRKLREAETHKPAIRIPDNVMVMGVGGDVLGAYVRPTLTTLELKPDGLGKTITDSMIRMIEDEWKPEAPEIIADAGDTVGGILLGESTAGPIRTTAEDLLDSVGTLATPR
jgi:DNA-binding LacI/PurR family transcriptional regulator